MIMAQGHKVLTTFKWHQVKASRAVVQRLSRLAVDVECSMEPSGSYGLMPPFGAIKRRDLIQAVRAMLTAVPPLAESGSTLCGDPRRASRRPRHRLP